MLVKEILIMSSFIKVPRFFFFYKCLLNSRQNLLITARSFTNFFKIPLCNNLVKSNITNSDPYKSLLSRQKTTSKKKSYKKEEEDDDDDSDDESDEDDYNFKNDEVKIFQTEAARVDKIIKVCFRISRREIENVFYQTKVRVNGKLLKKKSANANIGDEIDIINDFVNNNSKLINVNRIEILNIEENLENLGYSVKVKKSKSLIIQNYNGSDQWRG